MNKTITCILILILFAKCGSFAIQEKIIENYYITAPDDEIQASLSYHESTDGFNYSSIIEATVFSVGFNDKYMVVKQHPQMFNSRPDKTITNYYILPLKKGMDWRSKNGLIGPLTLEQFNEKRKELNIENIQFTKVIKDLE